MTMYAFAISLINHSKPALDEISPEEIFDLYDIAQALSLQVLANVRIQPVQPV